jgi:acetyltransferase-like isoleucine patch superfamily enzyme
MDTKMIFLKKILKPVYWFFRVIFKINLIKTIKINFSLLPFRQAIKFPVLVKGKFIIDSLKGKLTLDCPVKTGLILIGIDSDRVLTAANPVRLYLEGHLILRGNCFISQGTSIMIMRNSVVEFGKGVRIGSGCFLRVMESITIGDYSSFGSGCFIQDSNIHYTKDTKSGYIRKASGKIIIGQRCWILHSTVLGGTELPDYCIVARNSLLNKNYSKIYSPCSMLAGSPAKVVKENIQRIHNVNKEEMLNNYFRANPGVEYYQDKPGLEPPDSDRPLEWFSIYAHF